MSRGGARNRSGPQPDPTSERSDRRGYKLTALPSTGYTGDVPDFPLPNAGDREVAVWLDAWSTPQACAWSMEPWRWQTIAEYARFKAMCEREPNAALIGQLHRYRDQVGLTPAGMRENGWAIAHDEVTPKRETQPAPEIPARRLRAIASDAQQ